MTAAGLTMVMWNKIAFSLLLICFFSCLHAQRFGGNPSSMKWKQIDAPHIRLIFPEGVETEARRAVQIMERLSQQYHGSLGDAIRKVPVVLQTQPLVSNAYVGLAPWRSEFFMNPLQNTLLLGSTNWMDNLAVHEYRHVHQFSNFNKGLSRWAYRIAGEQGLALAVSAAIPDWFFEGDAVYHETQFLTQGRGRLPYFFDPLHAIWAANRKYSFMKLRNGSLKDIVPDHYALGFLLTSHGYRKFGNDFWGKVTHDAARYKNIVYPFQRAIKQHAGVGYKRFVGEALEEYQSRMPQRSQDAERVSSTDPRRVVDHHYPLWCGIDSVLVLKKAYNRLPQWLILSAGKETVLGVKEIGMDDYFTSNGKKIVYTGYRPDARWSWREYNDIILYDISQRTSRVITKNGRYFSPALSHDGNRLVAIHVAPGGTSSLHWIDADNGEIKKALPHPQREFLSYPVFADNESAAFVVARRKNGESAVLKLDLIDGQWTTVIPYVNVPISFLRRVPGGLLFNLSQSGRNQLCRWDMGSGKLQVLASDITGTYAGDVNPSTGQLVYSSPTADGEQVFVKTWPSVASGTTDALALSPLSTVYPMDSSLFSRAIPSAAQQNNDSSFSITPYRSLTDPVNIHSWRPLYERPEWSLTFYGENVLNTVVSSYSYVFNENEGSHKLGGNVALGKYYLWMLAGSNYTLNRTFKDASRTYSWNEWNGNLGFRLPLNFTKGKRFRRIDLSTGYNALALWYDNKNANAPKNRSIGYINQQFAGVVQTQRAVQHIFPHFAWAWNLQNRVAVGKTSAQQLFLNTQLYLPGLGRNHSFVMGASYQQRDTLRQYIFSNGFPTARGYAGFDFPRMARFSFNYHLPLAYPDLGFANIVYFLRVRSNFFYDQQMLKSLRTGVVTHLRSVGAEVYFDTKWWNQQPVTFGIRYSRLLDANRLSNRPNANQWELILPLDLIPN